MSWSATGNGQATFTTSAAHGMVVGQGFIVTLAQVAGFNGSYVAISGTTGSTNVAQSQAAADASMN